MKDERRIDLHLHSTVSDGTDTPEEILDRVRQAGMECFALTDHDAMKGCARIRRALRPADPRFLNGIEFSCRDEAGKYHILGYGYDPDSAAMRQVVGKGHRLRMEKASARLEFLKKEFGFAFPEEEVRRLLSLDNPGKPHIGNLMVKYGYAGTKDQAINGYLSRAGIPDAYIRPEEAIAGILQGGGIPVLAHPAYGSGNELIVGSDMEQRLLRLMDFGIQGMECFYSGFSPKLISEMLALAEKHGLYITAGSDYHGRNKLVVLGNTNYEGLRTMPEGMRRFLEDVSSG